ncbi:MAG: hypothetical protein HY897_12420 [Deltaproteobacteria bacterium]|nr:hypothetical protein [Deltaproteobacteria bacterium]
MRTTFSGLSFLACFMVFLAPPDVFAGTIEDELASLDKKIQSGGASPTDVQRFNDQLQTLQDQERKEPKNSFLKPKLRLNGRGQFQQGFGMSVSAAPAQTGTCGEFKNIYYNCAVLPWDAIDGWTRTNDIGAVSVRDCAPGDACLSDGVLGIDSNEELLFWRIEEGLVMERFASASFRMRQSLSERNPSPDTTLFGGGVVWIDDGVKSTAVGFVEDLNGDRLVLMPIEGHPDPETGEMNITEVIVAYHDWTVWHDYRLVRDAEGMVELLVDGDPTPVMSYPYDLLNMGSLGGPIVLFGNFMEGQNARVLFELDYFNYSVGMPNTGGCTSADGKMQLLSLINMTKIFDPTYEANDVVGRLRIATVEGLASNTQGHKFFLRASREIRDSAGNIIRFTINNTQIGPIGEGKNPPDMIAEGLSSWAGTDSQGTRVDDGVYTYGIRFDLVRADTKGKEKVLSTMQATGSPIILATSRTTPRVFKNVNVTKYYFAYDYIQNNEVRKFRNYAVTGCSVGADPILDVFYEQTGGQYTKVTTDGNTPFCRDTWPPGCDWGSHVTITPQKAGWVFMVIRAKALDKAGTCSMYRVVEGGGWTSWVKNFKFGGNRVDWSWAAGEEIQNVIMGDGEDTLVIQSNPGSYANPYEIPPDGTGKPSWNDDGGIAKASKVTVAAALSAGSTFIGQKPWAKEGVSHIYRNDVNNDTDGDGLGDGLEVELQTCKDRNSVAGGWVCSNAWTSRDTDGDGLTDDIEVFGCDKVCYNYAVPTIAKKGCFGDRAACPGFLAKSDFPQQLPKWGTDPRRKDILVEIDTYTNNPVQQASTLSEADAQRARNKFRDVSSTVENPDGTTGFAVHFDNGEQCTDSALCGNWGGSDRIVRVEPECRPSDLADTYFRNERKGLFHRGITQRCGTASSSLYGNTFSFHNLVPGAGNLLHELGHNLGLSDGGNTRDGAFQFKPNYTSVMNYAFAEKFNGSTELVHFSSGAFKSLNPKHLCESRGLDGADPTYLTYDPFQFEVSGVGGVDWNRDGYIEADCASPVEAFVHAAKRNAVNGRFFHYNNRWQNARASFPPVLATFNSSLVMFYVESKRLWYQEFRQMDGGCSPLDPWTACDLWESTRHEVSLPTSIVHSPGITEFRSPSGVPRLYVAFGGEEGGLWHVYAESWLDNWVVPMNSRLPDSTWLDAAPALGSDGTQLVVAYSDGASGQMFESVLAANGDWLPLRPSTDSNGNGLFGTGSPSFALRPFGESGVLHMAYAATPDGKITIMYRNAPADPWRIGVHLVTGTDPVISEPWATEAFAEGAIGFVWRPNPSIRPHGGHFHVLYVAKESGKLTSDFMSLNKSTRKWEWNMTSDTNVVASGGASLAFHEGGGLANVVAAFFNPTTDRIWFLPYVDGLYDLELKDGNDWKVMEKGACISVRSSTDDQCPLCGPDSDWCADVPNCCEGGNPPPPRPVSD